MPPMKAKVVDELVRHGRLGSEGGDDMGVYCIQKEDDISTVIRTGQRRGSVLWNSIPSGRYRD